jgi:hypothetical protein
MSKKESTKRTDIEKEIGNTSHFIIQIARKQNELKNNIQLLEEEKINSEKHLLKLEQKYQQLLQEEKAEKEKLDTINKE